ncbi:sensor histidine kinase [Streptomyces xanthii]|uniref:histidine kinase n=1 Tax=Streptomyces xanthii TaxID=2768069 RepID=A0A7H1BED0_9ACTN|nr:ATP-binding protein [Streptomyces xanthii]QNS07085.1 nitrate- and nitrite sensing domain-containing protein [Streptomyces xanthii]
MDLASPPAPATSVKDAVARSVKPRTIRSRLLRILGICLAGLLALLGVIAAGHVSDYRNAAHGAANARLEITLQAFVHELQKERGLTLGYVGGVTSFRAPMTAQRKTTDAARTTLENTLTEHDDEAADTVRATMGRLDALTGIRQSADNGTAKVEPTFNWFTSTLIALDRPDLGLEDVQDEQLRDAFRTLQVIGNAKEFTGEERAIVLGSLDAGGRFRGDDYSRFMQMRAGRLAALDAVPRTATPGERRRLADALSTPEAQRTFDYEDNAVRGAGKLSARDIPPMSWYQSITATIDGLRGVQVSIGDDIQARAVELERRAGLDLLLFLVFALVMAAAVGALARNCVRSVSGPLSRLADQARDVAGVRLPKAVAAVQAADGEQPDPPEPLTPDAHAGAEVRDVAEAFDRVQRAAFDLATEQAVLRRNATESLVSLGRRNQNLVRRQISFINRLEHEDADPDTLANLFELDHLATRMRRNAESLLVLAGESSPRTWSTALSMTDVLRASLSEVEEYRRVTLRRVDTAHISGLHVAEVAHLFAELVENALSFSPPESEVEIEGRRTSEGYLVAIVDHGHGMDSKALAEANVRLSGAAGFMAEPTRFLGHFVVGALARRCGIEVRLGEAPAAGVVARVLIPATLLTEPTAKDKKKAAKAAAAGRKSADGGRRPVDLPAPRAEREPAAHGAGADAAPEPGPAREPAAVSAAAPSAARTRNGLVKRPQRSAIAKVVRESGEPERPAPPAPAVERGPDQVSGMLSSLRSAHMRGAISVERERAAAEQSKTSGTTSGTSGTEAEGKGEK